MSTGMMMLDRLAPYYLIYGIAGYTFMFQSINFGRLKELLFMYVFMMQVFFAAPVVKTVNSSGIAPLTGRSWQYSYVPYYNVLYHPPEAEFRKDWNE
jgi:hypothetical protein